MANPLTQVAGKFAQLRAGPEGAAAGGALWGVFRGMRPALLLGIGAAVFVGLGAALLVAGAILGSSSVYHAWQNGKPALDAQRRDAQQQRQQAARAEAAQAVQPAVEAAPETPEAAAQPPGPHAQAVLASRQQRGPRQPG